MALARGNERRSFTLVAPEEGGRYHGKEPAQAARKAYRQLSDRSESRRPLTVTIRETTRGGGSGYYTYNGSWIRTAPRARDLGGHDVRRLGDAPAFVHSWRIQVTPVSRA
jgi:hypothetical protein